MIGGKKISKVMVVDDEEDIIYLVGNILRKAGHEVISADSGKKCLEMLEEEKPNLILMDVMMDEMDGWETARKVRYDSANEGIIISMLTVKSGDEDKIRSLDDARADWHIAKPIKRKKLLQTVDWLLKSPLPSSL